MPAFVAKVVRDIIPGWPLDPNRVLPAVVSDEIPVSQLITSHIAPLLFIVHIRIVYQILNRHLVAPSMGPHELPEESALYVFRACHRYVYPGRQNVC